MNQHNAGTGLPTTDTCLHSQGTASSGHGHGSPFPSHQPGTRQGAAYHSQFHGDLEEDDAEEDSYEEDSDEEDLDDAQDEATPDRVASIIPRPQVHSGSHLSGSLSEGADEADMSDTSSDELDDVDLTDAQREADYHYMMAHAYPVGPQPHDSTAPIFSAHQHQNFDAAPMMATEFIAGNIGPQAPNSVAVANAPAFGHAANVALPHFVISNPNPAIPGSENLGLFNFLHQWADQARWADSERFEPPRLHEVMEQARANVTTVNYSDLNGDCCDFQALDWAAMDTTRPVARVWRRLTYKNYVNEVGSDAMLTRLGEFEIPSHESYFRFKRMTMRRDIRLAHFQLRSVLACPSRTFAYYPSPMGINRFNTVSQKTDCVMSMRDFPAMGVGSRGALSTIDAGCGVLMGGTFSGEYYVKSLDCEDKTKFTQGHITSDFSGITNHINIYQPRRSSGPAAAIVSNDCALRILDINTDRFTSDIVYPFALNCTAPSPDHRLRVAVGDYSDVLIISADTGEILQRLSGHRDYGFACDWSDDGFTVATGFQDRGVKIWDARKWCNSRGTSTPLCTVRSEMASVRGLRFSPLGSGRPVLAAAEEADYVNLIDVLTFSSKQTFDVFGEIGGVGFTDEGQNLNVLCCDAHRGGLIQLERCGQRPEPILDDERLRDMCWFPDLVDRDDPNPLGNANGSRSRRPPLVQEEYNLQPF
ncbi:hypothetical protein E4U36_001704 [Claviceps purpurea]|nr:hypothetical protein E4U36_001704 [Claviceps purpurea]